MKKTMFLAAAIAALVLPAAAFAHAHVSPSVVAKGHSEVFTLAVPTEKDGATTTSIELTPPAGFNIDSFVPSPGWKRTVQQSGSGEDAAITKVTWTGGSVPTGEDSAFSFLASASAAKTYSFGVRQTYSDGTVVDWSGPESSDTPSPTIDAMSSLGGGGGSSTLALIALVVGAVGIVLGGISLLAKGGRDLA
jgi:uncharacterized protein YcnI